MDTKLVAASEWAREEFGQADLGDQRRTRRLIQVVEALADDPHGTLHRVMSNDWTELMGAYRLVGSSAVNFDRVTEAHHRKTRGNCSQPGEYLLIEDTTSLDFTRHWATEGLGRIGDNGGRGFYLHTTLALRVESWTRDQEPRVSMIGLLAQHCWARTTPTLGSTRESKRSRFRRNRESQRWADTFLRQGGPPPGIRWTLIADREADIYETFQRCRACGVDWIIRASQPRALVDQEGSILTAVSQTPPSGLEPLHWILLTSWPVSKWIPVLRVIKSYASRQLVEEYHNALKTGTGVEESQLTQVSSLQAWIGIESIVAVRLLGLKLLSRTYPTVAVTMEEFGPEARTILAKKFGEPKEGWTYQSCLVGIARLGGFNARKNDGMPGWISLWRGWSRLIILIECFQLAREFT